MGTDINGFVEIKKPTGWEQTIDLCKAVSKRNPSMWLILTGGDLWYGGNGLPEDFKKRHPITAFRIVSDHCHNRTYKEIKKINWEKPENKKALSKDWAELLKQLKNFARKYGDEGVRVVMWFT